MAKFKQVPQAFLFQKLMGFWGNMVKNYRSDVQDESPRASRVSGLHQKSHKASHAPL